MTAELDRLAAGMTVDRIAPDTPEPQANQRQTANDTRGLHRRAGAFRPSHWSPGELARNALRDCLHTRRWAAARPPS
jgi:hypothetical protein